MVDSNAACCEVTVDKGAWGKDVLLQWVCGLASDKQLSVTVVKKGGSLGLKVGSCSYVLTERNAIIRSLCGMALLNALDHSPTYLLGGCSESSGTSTSTGSGSGTCSSSALTLASIGSWMSLASTIANNNNNNKDDNHPLSSLWAPLNSHLGDKSFLVANTPQPTLADYDLAFAMMTATTNTDSNSNSNMDTSTSMSQYPNVHRWLTTTLELAHHFNPTNIALPSLPATTTTTTTTTTAAPLFLHFPGSHTIASAASTTPTQPAPQAAAASNPSKQPQQQQEKKEMTEEEKKAVAEKRAKMKMEKKQKANHKKQAAPAAIKEAELTIAALDIRVGQIRKVWDHPDAEKLYCEEIDVGEETTRNIASGLRPFYSLDEMMTDRRVLVLCNLKKRNLLGFASHGMVLCASNDDHSQVQFVIPPADAKIGERVTFTNIDMLDPQPDTKVHKKKILQQLAPDLQTDKNGMVFWKSSQHMASTSAGPCHAIQQMPNAHVS